MYAIMPMSARPLRDADIVVNAAALKQVPACEYFPTQAVMTNCMGASNIVQAIRENDYPVEYCYRHQHR